MQLLGTQAGADDSHMVTAFGVYNLVGINSGSDQLRHSHADTIPLDPGTGHHAAIITYEAALTFFASTVKTTKATTNNKLLT